MPVYSLGEKKPQLPEEGLYWVAPDAHIIGNVVLGKNVGVWFGSVWDQFGSYKGAFKQDRRWSNQM